MSGRIDGKRIIGDIDLGYDGQASRPARVTHGGHIYGQPVQGIYGLSAALNYVLGTERYDGESKYRYCRAGAPGAAPGLLYQMPIPDATNLNLVPVGVYAIGATTFIITLGAGGALANEYTGGYLYVNAGTGLGTKLRILTNTLAVGAVACTIVTQDGTPVAFDATSRFSLVRNPYAQVIVHPSPPTAMVVGVPLLTVPANNFFWLQVKGPVPILTDLVVNIGQFVKPSRNVDGAVQAADLSFLTGPTVAAVLGNGALVVDSQGAEVSPRLANTAAATRYDAGQMETIVGKVLRVNATTQYSLIDLMLD